MGFTFTPPVVVDGGLGFSVIQTSDMLSAESLVIRMERWSALEFLRHWHSEIAEVLASRRDLCCLVSGLALKRRALVPSEWWTLYHVDGRIRMHYQVILPGQVPAHLTPDQWWTKIPPYSPSVSEWSIQLTELVQWSKQCEVLFGAMRAVEND